MGCRHRMVRCVGHIEVVQCILCSTISIQYVVTKVKVM